VEEIVISHYSESSGKIIAFPAEPGQPVNAGDVLAILDTRQEALVLEQLEAMRRGKQAALDELLAGADPEELQQLQNNVSLAQEAYQSARLTADKARQDLADAQILYDNGFLAADVLDDLTYQAEIARSALETADIRIDSARQQFQLLAGGASQNRIIMAAADLAQTESQIRQSQDRIARGTITALADGTVISKYYLLGDVVVPGSNLADIAAETGKYVVAYWPEDRLALLTYGQEMTVRPRSDHSAAYLGTLMFMDVSAAYTPKEEQTADNRNKTSLRIKVRLSADVPLRPGEIVTVSR
jgi:HlyD family secretion protein